MDLKIFNKLSKKLSGIWNYGYKKIKFFNKFGTKSYIDYIAPLVDENPRVALGKIINDTQIFINDLKKLSDESFKEFYGFINLIAEKLDDIDMEVHFFRNLLNRAPETLNELIDYNKNIEKGKRWVMLPPMKSAFHMKGEDGIFNLKFVSYDGHFEAVYNKNGNLLGEKNDPVNMGTYNFFSPDDEKGHIKYDVEPYFKWGNTKDADGNGEIEELAIAAKNIAKHKLSKEAKEWYNKIKSEFDC